MTNIEPAGNVPNRTASMRRVLSMFTSFTLFKGIANG